jgi:hypothetical protein
MILSSSCYFLPQVQMSLPPCSHTPLTSALFLPSPWGTLEPQRNSEERPVIRNFKEDAKFEFLTGVFRRNIPYLELYNDIILPALTVALGSTQPLTEMSTRNISQRVKAAGVYG